MNTKIESDEEFNEEELLLLSLLCFMDYKNDVEHAILDSAVTITNINDLDEEISQFVTGVVLMLCDKFVKDKSINKTVSNLVGGNMKIVEDYAQRKVDESKKRVVINLNNEGYNLTDIARIANVSLDFVERTLAE
jgi:hypothetical protein